MVQCELFSLDSSLDQEKAFSLLTRRTHITILNILFVQLCDLYYYLLGYSGMLSPKIYLYNKGIPENWHQKMLDVRNVIDVYVFFT